MTDELISNGYNLDLFEGIPVPMTYAIADALNPSKRKQSFSKQTDLPDTANNNAFFTGAFTITSTESSVLFDATAKVEVQLYKRGVPVLKKGVLKLDKVTIVNGVIRYTVTVLSESVDYFQLLSTVSINELDWSAYDHVLSRANIKASWSATPGTGYYYGLMERGNARLGTLIWRTTDLYPYAYFREVMQKTLEFAGITLDSTFLDTDLVKNLVFGFGGGELKTIAPSDINQRKIEIDSGEFTDTYTTFLNTGYFTANNLAVSRNLNYSPQVSFKNSFSDDVFTSVTTQDILSQFDNGEIDIQFSGNYQLNIGMIVDYAVSYGTMTFNGISGAILRVKKNGLIMQEVTTSSPVFFTDTGTFTLNQNNIFNMSLTAGDTISFEFRVQGVGVTADIGVEPQNVTVDLTTDVINNPITIDFTCIDTTVGDGDTVQLGLYLPAMKCSEFLMGAIKQFNLYADEPTDDNLLPIEPLTDFYSATNVFTDITKLIDHSKPIQIRPSANEYAKNITYKFKKAPEYDAIKYLDKWGEEYGDYSFTQSSYYAKGEQKTELPWATCVPYDIGGGVIVPRFVKIDVNTLKPLAGPPRLMFRQGLVNGNIVLRNTTTSESLTQYGGLHHFDSRTSPTFDLNFKLVNELYYTTNVITTKNSYSEYYSTFINEMISKAGQIVNASLYWTEIDIKNRDWGKLLMIDGALFRLNLIKEFSADVQATTEIELVKVLKAKKSRRFNIPITAVAVTIDNTLGSPTGVGEDVGVVVTPPDKVGLNSIILRG